MLKKIIKNASILSIGILAGRLSGYAREFSIAYLYKVTETSDSIILLLALPDLLNNLLGAGVISALTIPYLSDDKVNSHDFLSDFTRKIFLLSIVLFSCVAVFSIYSYPLSLAVNLIISSLSIFPNVLTAIFVSYLAYKQSFSLQSLSGLIFNVIFIIFLFLFERLELIAVGVIIASIIRMIIAYFKSGLKFNLITKSEKTNYTTMMSITVVMASTGLMYINPIIDKIFASHLQTGSVAILSYAEKLYLLPISVVLTTVAVSMFPGISALVEEKKYSYLNKLVRKVVLINVVLAILIASVYFFWGRDIVSLVYKMTHLQESQLDNIYLVLKYYLPGLCFAGLNGILINVVYAFKKYRFSLYYSIAMLLLNIIGDYFILLTTGKIEHIALITSFVTVISVIILLISFKSNMQDNNEISNI